MDAEALPEEERKRVNQAIDHYNGEHEDGMLSKEEFVKLFCKL